MPNWCENTLEIHGPIDELIRFFEFAKTDKNDEYSRYRYSNRDGNEWLLDMNRFIPYPKKYKIKDLKVQKVRNREDFEKEKANFRNMDGEQRAYWLFKNREESWGMKDGFNSGGYEWCCTNWGTKWNFCYVSSNVTTVEELKKQDYLQYFFQTAWGPPNPVIAKMIKLFPKLEFELNYFEPGNAYKGVLTGSNGKIIDDRNWNMEREDWEEYYQESPDLLQDMFPGEYDDDGNRIKKEGDDNAEAGDNNNP